MKRALIVAAGLLVFATFLFAQGIPGSSSFYLAGNDPWWRPYNPQGQAFGVSVGTTRPVRTQGCNDCTPRPGELFLDMDGAADGGPQLEVYDNVNDEWNSFTDNDTSGVTIGTLSTVPKFGADDLADSTITDDGTTVGITVTNVDLVTAGLVFTTGGVVTGDAAVGITSASASDIVLTTGADTFTFSDAEELVPFLWEQNVGSATAGALEVIYVEVGYGVPID